MTLMKNQEQENKLKFFEMGFLYFVIGVIFGFLSVIIENFTGFDLNEIGWIIVIIFAGIVEWIFVAFLNVGIVRRKTDAEKKGIRIYIIETVLAIIGMFLASFSVSGLTFRETLVDYSGWNFVFIFIIALGYVWFRDQFTWQKLK